MEKEIWKDVAGYEGYYKVSNLGRVKSIDRIIINSLNIKKLFRGKILKTTIHPDGYLLCSLSIKNRSLSVRIHRLVAEAFLINSENKPVVNHKNGVRDDNRLENLEWVTVKENVQHSFKSGLRKSPNFEKFGKLNHRSKPIIQMTKNGDFIKRYESGWEAERATGIDQGSIARVCLGRYKTAGKFIWKHA